ncbi:MAG: winged helix-turn-helix domain-containing protein [Kiritimatiellae bacterium]|nr:winged helix-turn-helix domain-containing protein [Kiritimatiellia bacterium]
MSKSAIRAGDRAFVKVGRNLVEVRVDRKAEDGWSVTSRTGKSMTVKTLLTAEGETLEAHEAGTPARAAKAKPAAPSPKAVPQKGLGLLSAAAAVLERSDAPMSVKAMIEAAKSEGLWTPGAGKTPEQTLYSAIIREIKDKGDQSRFRKEGRGLFAFAK